MNRFSDSQSTDPIITVPMGPNNLGILRAAETVIIKTKKPRFMLRCKRFCLSTVFLTGVVAALSSVVLALLVLIINT